jgi:hypothetical protein
VGRFRFSAGFGPVSLSIRKLFVMMGKGLRRFLIVELSIRNRNLPPGLWHRFIAIRNRCFVGSEGVKAISNFFWALLEIRHGRRVGGWRPWEPPFGAFSLPRLRGI